MATDDKPKRFLINTSPGNYVVGTRAKRLNKGNDEEYPTFELEDGRLYGTHRSKVKVLNDN